MSTFILELGTDLAICLIRLSAMALILGGVTA